MSIHSRLFAAALVAGAVGLLVLPLGHAQQPTTAPARRAGSAASTIRVPVQVLRSYAEGGGYKTEYREEQYVGVTPELQQLHAAEIEAANEAQAHVSALAKASESDREALKTAIRGALVRQFDAQQKRRSEEIASIEERLGKLKETLQKRGAAKEAIVNKRLDQLMGVKDDLAWEETRPVPPRSALDYPPRLYAPAAPITASGVSGVPTTPVPGRTPQSATPAAPSAWPVPVPPAAAPAAPDSGFGSGFGVIAPVPTPPAAAPASPAPPAPATTPIAPVPPSAPAPAAPR